MVAFRTWRASQAAALAVIACSLLAATGCGSSPASASGSSGSGAPNESGTASVAYAGSLENLNEKTVGPAFTKSTGYAYAGRGAGSKALSEEIASGEITPNVFESVGAGPIKALVPQFTRWWVQFAASPIVLAFNPQSKYASQFKAYANGSKPLAGLFTLLATPGLKLGRTNPNTDPQGVAFIQMLELARMQYNLPAGIVDQILGGTPSSGASAEIFSETALEPRLQAGQLDAASAFLSQAVQLHLDYIPLPDTINLGSPGLAAQYAKASVTLANGTVSTGAPLVIDITTIGKSSKAADAFVAYVLSKAGLAMHKHGGYTLLPPTIGGDSAAVPASIKNELDG